MGFPEIAEQARSRAFSQYVQSLLMELCRIDTTPCADVNVSREAEAKVFTILERELAGFAFSGLRCERRPIKNEIASHPFFSQLYYTATPQRPAGLGVEETYCGRTNLLVFVDGAQRDSAVTNQAFNAHVDVVRPYIPPRQEEGKVLGRGACDDKGSVVAFLAALKLLSGFLKSSGKQLSGNLTGMIVIEEETGGNGSLSLAIDRDLKQRYDSLMVLECCRSQIYPGNRGALWYKIEMRQGAPDMNLFEAAALVIEEMEKEGRAIKSESAHPLFPHRPVQTCHGIIGNYGEHPSRINGRVDFDIVFAGTSVNFTAAVTLVRDVIDFALAEYIGVYGDKTKEKDAAGKPKVDHHYDLLEKDGALIVQLHGSTGHMGSILQNDCAITKMATIVRALLRSREAIAAAAGASIRLHLHGWPDDTSLVLEGGQGFLPTHDMPQVMQRICQAAQRGVENYQRSIGAPSPASVKVTFDKLHNAAFAGSADSQDVKNAVAAAAEVGIPSDGPIRGFDVSCDARIFACEYPEMPVLTSGPGALVYAHADNEQVEIGEITRFAEFLANFILKQNGTVERK